MVHSPYLTLILLPEHLSPTLQDLQPVLEAAVNGHMYPAWGETEMQVHADVMVGAYAFHFSLETEPHVLVEAQEIFGHLGVTPTLLFPRRLSMSGHPDPDLTYFNDYLFLLSALEEQLLGAVFYDPYAGERIEL